MSNKILHYALREIGLSLLVVNKCVVTDTPSAQPQDGYSWRIDNTKAIYSLALIEQALISSGIYRGCECCNTFQSNDMRVEPRNYSENSNSSNGDGFVEY